MKTILLNLVRLGVILGSVIYGAYALVIMPKTVLAAGLLVVFRNLFSDKLYDPIFKDESAQGWAWGHIKKLATRKRPTPKFDV